MPSIWGYSPISKKNPCFNCFMHPLPAHLFPCKRSCTCRTKLSAIWYSLCCLHLIRRNPTVSLWSPAVLVHSTPKTPVEKWFRSRICDACIVKICLVSTVHTARKALLPAVLKSSLVSSRSDAIRPLTPCSFAWIRCRNSYREAWFPNRDVNQPFFTIPTHDLQRNADKHRFSVCHRYCITALLLPIILADG